MKNNPTTQPPMQSEPTKKTGKLVGVCNCGCHCELKECFSDHDNYCEHCDPTTQPEQEQIFELIASVRTNGAYPAENFIPEIIKKIEAQAIQAERERGVRERQALLEQVEKHRIDISKRAAAKVYKDNDGQLWYDKGQTDEANRVINLLKKAPVVEKMNPMEENLANGPTNIIKLIKHWKKNHE